MEPSPPSWGRFIDTRSVVIGSTVADAAANALQAPTQLENLADTRSGGRDNRALCLRLEPPRLPPDAEVRVRTGALCFGRDAACLPLVHGPRCSSSRQVPSLSQSNDPR